MLANAQVQAQLKQFICVKWYYDGLKGSVIAWTNTHGNTNHDPSQQAWILDPQGNEISRGRGKTRQASSFSGWLEKNSKSSFPLLDPKRYKHLKTEATSIARRKRLGTTLAGLRKKATRQSDKPEVKAEAQQLLDKLLTYAQWQVRRAAQLKDLDPVSAYAMYKSLARDFKGDQIGADAKKTYDALRKDKQFQGEIKAARLLERVHGIAGHYKNCRYGRPLDIASCADCRKKNLRGLQGAASLLGTIIKRYPKTKAAVSARKLIEDWKLK